MNFRVLEWIKRLICWKDYEPDILILKEENQNLKEEIKDLKAKLGISESFRLEYKAKLNKVLKRVGD